MPRNTVKEIIAAGQRLAAGGLIRAYSGNISCRVDGPAILITASGVFKGGLGEQDILLLDNTGRIRQGAAGRMPSSETFMHLAIYNSCPHVQAIVHAHPPYATALASLGRELEHALLEESALLLGPVPLLPRFSAGSKELAQAAAEKAACANALLLAGHGAVSWGESMEQALARMEILEHTAQVMLLRGLFAQGASGHV
ncbi:MAG: class II aldolase/adducin family protein [Clostridiales bacterium]|nr:class II aldolase/adducin family protein [Clostridiales bacterium]